MAEYFSVIWIVFVRKYGFIMLGNMDFAEILKGLTQEYAFFLKETSLLYIEILKTY